MFEVYSDSTLDYIEEFNDLTLSLRTMDNDDMINEACMEMMVLLNTQYTNSMVLEKVDIGANSQKPTARNIETLGGHIADYFRRIVKFVQGLIDKFMNNLTSTFDDEYDWFKKNSEFIDKMPKEVRKDIKITAINYDEGVKRLEASISNGNKFTQFIQDGIKKIERDAEIGKITDLDSLKYIIEKIVTDQDMKAIFSSKENVAKAAKMYFMGEDEKAQPMQEYKNDEAIKRINVMKEFIGRYRNTCNSLKSSLDAFKNGIDAAAKNFERGQATKVSSEGFYANMYSILEESSVFAPGVFTGAKVSYVTEDPNGLTNVGDDTKKDNPPPKDDKKQTEPTKTENNPTDNQATTTPKDMSEENRVKVAKKLTELASGVCSGVMSALQTIKDHYMGILQQVVNAVKKYQGIKEEDMANKNFNYEKDLAKHKAQREEAKKGGLVSHIKDIFNNPPPTKPKRK